MPGRIEKYDSKTRKATVLPLIKKKYLDGKIIPFKPIEEVPVMFYGVNAAGLRLPESEFTGQTVTLIFAERSLDFWLEKGTETEPGLRRKFDLTDAIAILSLNSFNNEDQGGDNLELFFKDGIVRIRPDGIIEIGKDDFLRLINENFKIIYERHKHNITTLPAGGTGVTSVPVDALSLTPVIDPGAPGPPITFASVISDDEMTNKVKAE